MVQKITVCLTCDILVIGVDHLKDQESIINDRGVVAMKRFTSLFYLTRIFLALNASLLVMALCQSSLKTTFVTAVFTTPAFLWATPLDLQ